MKLFREEIRKLQKVKVKPDPPRDLLKFWSRAGEKIRGLPLDIERRRVDFPLDKMSVFDISFSAIDGTRIKGKLILPPEARSGKQPVIIHYHGAGGGSAPADCYSSWILLGAAVLAIDFRNQSGMTGSASGFGEGPSCIFGMGIMDKERCGIYNLYTDAMRAVEAAKATPEIDSARIGVTGGSQGGGVALAVAALSSDVKLCMADVPSSCWFEKRLFDKSGGVADLSNFVKNRPETLERILDNLGYFDNVNLAPQINCPVLVSCGLRDPVCPPENVYAAYNNIRSEKHIHPYLFAQHEGGGALHGRIKLEFFKKKLMK